MDITMKAKKPMTREEVNLLIDLVEKRPVIISKKINATANSLKEEAWASLTNEYNANDVEPKNCVQLRLKWENLKKAARKMHKNSILNNYKTSRGDYIPHNKILSRVACLTAPARTTFEVPLFDSEGVSEANTSKPDDSVVRPRRLYQVTNMSRKMPIKKAEKKTNYEDDGRRERNLAIAEYFNTKTTKLNLEIELLRQELAKKNSNIDDIKLIKTVIFK